MRRHGVLSTQGVSVRDGIVLFMSRNAEERTGETSVTGTVRSRHGTRGSPARGPPSSAPPPTCSSRAARRRSPSTRIVARSGVAKSTIYRHWESRDEILLAVFERAPRTRPSVAEASPFEHGAAHVRRRRSSSTFSDPQWARLLPALLMLKTHEDGIAALEHRLETPSATTLCRAMLRRGIDEGVLRAGPRRRGGHGAARRAAAVRPPDRHGRARPRLRRPHVVDAFLAAYGSA